MKTFCRLCEVNCGLEATVDLMALVGFFTMTCLSASAFDIDPPADAPSDLAVVGRYVLSAKIMELGWSSVSIILLAIIATVVVSEWVSARVRHAII